MLADATAALSAPSPSPSRRVPRRDDDSGRAAQSLRRREGGSGGQGSGSLNNSHRSVGSSVRQVVETVQRITSRHRLTDASGHGHSGSGSGSSSGSRRPGSPTRLVPSQATAGTSTSAATADQVQGSSQSQGPHEAGDGGEEEEAPVFREDSGLVTTAVTVKASTKVTPTTASATAAALAAAAAAVAAAAAALRVAEGGRGATDEPGRGDAASLPPPADEVEAGADETDNREVE